MSLRFPRASLMALALLGVAAGCGANKQHAEIERAGKELRFDLAQMYVEKGAREQAIPLLRRILAEQPQNHAARVLYGSVLRDLGLYPQSRAELLRVLTAAPKYAPAHASIGILYDLEHNFAKAKQHHLKAVALAPGNAEFANNLGFSYYLTRQPKTAIKYLERALALDPGLAIAYNNLGFAYGEVGALDKAERSFRTALDEAGALYNMAMVYELRGDSERAATTRERAFSRNPELRVRYLSEKNEAGGLSPFAPQESP